MSSSPSILRLPERSPLPSLLRRIAVVVGVILVTTVLLYFTRGGLRDNTHPERDLSFIDVLYFTVISVTTVGYGDIVPVTAGARLVYDDVQRVLETSNAHLHLYGKEAISGRKIGHVTLCEESEALLRVQREAFSQTLLSSTS